MGSISHSISFRTASYHRYQCHHHSHAHIIFDLRQFDFSWVSETAGMTTTTMMTTISPKWIHETSLHHQCWVVAVDRPPASARPWQQNPQVRHRSTFARIVDQNLSSGWADVPPVASGTHCKNSKSIEVVRHLLLVPRSEVSALLPVPRGWEVTVTTMRMRPFE